MDVIFSDKTSPVVTIIVSAVVSVAIGTVIGYKFAKSRLAKEYDARLEAELNATQKYYISRASKDGYDTPANAVEALIDEEAKVALLKYQGTEEPETEDDEEVNETVTVNVFHNDYNFDLEEEMKTRTSDRPYVIMEQEYLENDPDHEQTDLIYYVGDDVLADENDTIIEDANTIVGDDNLVRFGEGSQNNNVVFIRNEAIDTDFEVLRSFTKYSEQILGFIEHDDTPKIRKFRRDG